MAAATGRLSAHDSSVLNAIFGGEHGAINFSSNKPQQSVIVNVELTPDPHLPEHLVEQLVLREKALIKELDEQSATTLVDSDQLRKMELAFTQIIEEQPLYASAYNNRAQVVRMQLLNCADSPSERAALYPKVLEDLQKAVDYALPDGNKNQQVIVSKMQANILKSAYSQMGATYTAMSEDESYLKTADVKQWDLEEKASSAFFSAGEFGDEIARAMATRVNPYAKLCGNIVQEALARERAGY